MEEIKEVKKVEAEPAPKIEEKKVDPYIMYGQDFSITQTSYIDFYKNRLKFLAFKNNLVGRFNQRGHYVIAPEVKADLVRMPKEIEDMGSDFYKASNVYMKKFFYFDVKIVMGEHGKAKASLYLTENVGAYMENPHIISHIADFEDVYDDEFRVKLRKIFNLVDIAVPVSDLMVPELAVIMQDNFDYVVINEGLYDIISQIYVLRMLELLEKSGPEGQKVVERYKELIAENEPELNIKYKNNVLKALLDRAIDENGGLEALNVNKEVKGQVVNEVNSSVGKIEQVQKAAGVEAINTHSKEAPKSEKNDKGAAAKKTSAKKTAAKKAVKKAEKAAKPSKGGKESHFDFLNDIAAEALLDDEKGGSKGSSAQPNNAGKNDLPGHNPIPSAPVKEEKQEIEEINLDDEDTPDKIVITNVENSDIADEIETVNGDIPVKDKIIIDIEEKQMPNIDNENIINLSENENM